MKTAWLIAPDDAVAQWTLAPFRYLAPQRLAQLRLRVRQFRQVPLGDVHSLVSRSRADVVFVATSWREPAEDTMRVFERLSSDVRRPKIVYLDTFDQTSSPYFSLLPHVDVYVKKQLLDPVSRYRETLHGGDVLADYYVREHGFDLGDWTFGSRTDGRHDDRLALGWNLGSAFHLARGLAASHLRRRVRWAERGLDVHYRVGLHSEDLTDWYSFHRNQWREALAPLAREGRNVVAAGKSGRVPLAQFEAEVRDAKIAVSPFGWGEVTDRDFHAITNGSLLIKPDMSHLRTEPNIYQAGVTYVPVQWDGSDLVERCRYYLAHPQEAQQIAQNARRVYRDWLMRGGFTRRLAALLDRLGLSH